MRKNLFLFVLAMLMAMPMMAKKHTETLPTGIKIGGRTSFTFDGSYGYMDNMSLTYYNGTGKKETATGTIKKINELSSADKGGNQVWWMPSKNLLLLHNVNLSTIPSLVETTGSGVTIVVSGDCKVNTTGNIGASGKYLLITSLCGIKGADKKTAPYLPTANNVINNDKQKTNKLTINKPISVTWQLTVGALRLDVRKLNGTKDATLKMFDLNAANVEIEGFGEEVTSDHCGIQYSEVKNRALVLNHLYQFYWLPIDAKKEIEYNDMKRATSLNIVAGVCSEKPRADVPLVALRFNPLPGSYGNPANNNYSSRTIRIKNAAYNVIFTTGFVITLPYPVLNKKDWEIVPAYYSKNENSTVSSFTIPSLYTENLVGFKLSAPSYQVTSGAIYFIPGIGLYMTDANVAGELLSNNTAGLVSIYINGTNSITKRRDTNDYTAIKSKGTVHILGNSPIAKLTLSGMNAQVDKTFFIKGCDFSIGSLSSGNCLVSQNGEFACENANVELYAPQGYTVVKTLSKVKTYGCGIYNPKAQKEDITFKNGMFYTNNLPSKQLKIVPGKWPNIMTLDVQSPWSLKTAVQEYEKWRKNIPQVAQ